MLQAIREKTTGWIAYAIILLISIPFVLMGLNSYFGGGELAPAAIVDGEEISSRQLDYAYANYQRRLRSVFGGEIPDALNNEAVLKEQVRDQIINEQVLSQYVAGNNFRLSNQALTQKITSMSVFQQDGKFSSELYQAELGSQGLATVQFEEDLRRSEEMTQIRRAIVGSEIESKSRQTEQNSFQNQQRKIRSITLPLMSEGVEVTDAELKQEYDKNAVRYKTQEKVKVDYIEVNLATLKSKIEVTDQELRNYYDDVKEGLTATETRNAKHILLQVDEDASSSDKDEKERQIIALKDQLNSGANFADLAREHSEDPGSASDGGDLGGVERGMMVEPFEDALFALSEGEVSAPVKTSFGWHLIQLDTIEGGQVPTFEAKRFELKNQLETEKAEGQIYELAENLSNLSYEQPDSLVPAAEQLNLEVKTTDWFSRNQGAGVASEAKVRALAFSNDVLSLNRNSETLELSDNNLIVIHLNEHQPSALPELDSIKPQLEINVLKSKSRQLTVDKGKQGLEQAKSGEFDRLADLWGQSITDSGFVKRDSNVISRDLVSLAFKMNKPDMGASFQGVELASGDYAIVEVSELKTQIVDTPKGDNKSSQGEANYEYQAWIRHKVQQADIVKTPLAELQ